MIIFYILLDSKRVGISNNIVISILVKHRTRYTIIIFNNMESLPDNIEEYKKFKVVDLKQFLSNVGLPTNGKVFIASKFLNAVR